MLFIDYWVPFKISVIGIIHIYVKLNGRQNWRISNITLFFGEIRGCPKIKIQKKKNWNMAMHGLIVKYCFNPIFHIHNFRFRPWVGVRRASLQGTLYN